MLLHMDGAHARPTWFGDRGYPVVEKALYWMGRGVLEVGARAMFQLDVLRHAPLPDGPKIIAPNHPSTTDPFLTLMLVPEQASILIDDRLFKVPAFGRYLHLTGHVPVVPDQGGLAYEGGKRVLRTGRPLVVFPEGAISPEGGLHAPRTGVARLALETGAPVIPVGVHLDRERIRLVETEIDGETAVGTWYLGGPYAMTVGKPMWCSGDVQDRALVRSISEQIMQRIALLTQESADRVGDRRRARRVPKVSRWAGLLGDAR